MKRLAPTRGFSKARELTCNIKLTFEIIQGVSDISHQLHLSTNSHKHFVMNG